MKVVIVGSGNVATVLGKRIASAGHNILEVASRSLEHAQQLAGLLQTSATNKFNEVNPNADLYLLCVADKSIPHVANQLSHINKLIAHTAGAVSKNVLQSFASYGVVYPLQSLKKEITGTPDIPVFIDGNNEETISLLKEFSTGWASTITIANDDMRLKLHVAAVIANNFTNHLFTLTQEFCRNESIDFNNLLPLITETVHRLHKAPAETSQTGPAKRRDLETMNIHEQILTGYPGLHQLYLQLSQSIMDNNTRK